MISIVDINGTAYYISKLRIVRAGISYAVQVNFPSR